MKRKAVQSAWVYETNRRLDAKPFLSGAFEARMLLKHAQFPRQPLSEVTERVFHAGRESRLWVEDPDHGVPFLGSTAILKADYSNLPLISKKQVARNPGFIIRQGWTLITRSGTIGRMAYVRPDMDAMACSEHAMRVVPDEQKIPSGYLYAFLSSKFGVPMVTSGTYGAIIQHIEPEHIADLPVPRLGTDAEGKAHELIELAARSRTRASMLLREAQDRVESLLGDWRQDVGSTSAQWTGVPSSSLVARCDAYYFSKKCLAARRAFDSAEGCETVSLDEVAAVFIPGIFKRRYADQPEYGHPYITGADVFQNAPTSDQFLLKSVANEYELLVQKGTILIQEAGQLGGLIGRSVLVGEYLNGFAVSNNMVRVTAKESVNTGYLYAVLSCEPGVILISREAAGSSIPHLEVTRVRRMGVPWAEQQLRREIGELVIDAWDLRDKACDLDSQARSLVERAIEDAA